MKNNIMNYASNAFLAGCEVTPEFESAMNRLMCECVEEAESEEREELIKEGCTVVSVRREKN